MNPSLDTLVRQCDRWLDRSGPESSVVASSRVRLARNLPDLIFPPRARGEDLARATALLHDAITKAPTLQGIHRIPIPELTEIQRAILKESHIISNELERGGEHRVVYVNDDASIILMLNEEDHLRLCVLMPGLQLEQTYKLAATIDEELQRGLDFAFHDQFGYLSACATNTGTGMRASVMLHLPGLAITKKLETTFIGMPDNGLTVRGYYGENTEFLGDYYQISNERTLGKSEEDILETLDSAVKLALKAESSARAFLFRERLEAIDDAIWRSYAILGHARIMETSEAAKLLSKIRLGVDRGYFGRLSHESLNKLVVEIQPGHLTAATGQGPMESEQRDVIRARLLRTRFASLAQRN